MWSLTLISLIVSLVPSSLIYDIPKICVDANAVNFKVVSVTLDVVGLLLGAIIGIFPLASVKLSVPINIKPPAAA